MDIKFYEVSNDYIKYFKKYDRNVRLNEGENYQHNRKYIGVILEINSLKYFAPLSSPKGSDYKDDTKTIIRKSKIFIHRIVYGTQLLATVRISNMIPVPDRYINLYDLDNEPDRKYKKLLLKQFRVIKREFSEIKKSALRLYTQKNKGEKHSYLRSTIDFKKIEQKSSDYIKKLEDFESHVGVIETSSITKESNKSKNNSVDVESVLKKDA